MPLSVGSAAGWTGDSQFVVSDPDGTYGGAAVTLSYFNNAFWFGTPLLWASVTGVSLIATGQTTLYTIPNTPILTGKKFFVTDILVRIASISGFVSAATFQVGKAAAYNEYMSGVAPTGLTTVGNYKLLSEFAGSATIHSQFNLGDVIKIDVTSAAISTTLTADFYLFGIYI